MRKFTDLIGRKTAPESTRTLDRNNKIDINRLNEQAGEKKLFTNQIGKNNYEQTDAGKAWAQLQNKWNQYRDNPTEENKENLTAPIFSPR